ncbi:hypothetical protein GCM10010978_28480 [Compostibacillus humi]|jgi:hypothetical protein|uniref:NERD domain-containing protein n=1 Tax=Compostibacillus humi TaxID=1245525 RepID=A0A8J2TUM3_9BACI|nr:nuclease-related domain-containing protein [Compostibacillus humi]GFZ86904.1 hypothetical protein GCM10010978_28480 [Compostibacillus humi]HLT54912.1 nuclease-related domain-containing protein [Bacillota bacterium]
METFLAKREMPLELLLYESLSRRKNLNDKEQKYYLNLKRGYEGEVIFSEHTEELKGKHLVLTDLIFECNQTIFQIDCLIITQERIYLYEVKNYEGDFYFEGDKFFKKPRLEVMNPLHQLGRTESLFRQLLQSFGFQTPVKAYVVFVNPAFTLYQAPIDIPIIFPTQIKKHIELVSIETAIVTSSHKRLAKKLIENRRSSSPYQQLPSYEYNDLRKGIVCASCGSLSVMLVKRACVCKVCGRKEPVSKAILRSVKEFQLLFPNRKVSTSQIYDWCKIIESKKSIQRVLSNNFKAVGSKRWTYYE